MKLVGFITFIILCFSCKHKTELTDHSAISKHYYMALNEGETKEEVASLLSTTLINIQGADTARYTQETYKDWIAWDRLFEPTYKVISSVNIDDHRVKIKIEKNDKRIGFLNEEPVVYTEIHTFENQKLSRIELQDYQVFNDSLWIAKRTMLTSYIKENHPELDGFIIDQTADGAKKYLAALTNYKSK
ncbi:hypothetical protein [Dokdonia sp. Hel_I_53]|uniref:hypothetical protein n=1 Tax=Dokdonia sp. Hel_I_53 TaxID=1566287 RepID=UPI00119AF2EC|nr:hypothetical protein [Dokdonia sp. Hel_I_53]TVZ51868.1 hypothetical protein OD90_1027 [Dokdonia sp. Hel_I_53]